MCQELGGVEEKIRKKYEIRKTLGGPSEVHREIRLSAWDKRLEGFRGPQRVTLRKGGAGRFERSQLPRYQKERSDSHRRGGVGTCGGQTVFGPAMEGLNTTRL